MADTGDWQSRSLLLQGGQDVALVLADDNGTAEVGSHCAHQVEELGALGVTAADPDASSLRQRGQCGLGGVRVGGLGVVDPGDAIRLGDGDDPVGSGAVGAQARRDRLGVDPGRAGQSGCGQGVGEQVSGQVLGTAPRRQVRQVSGGGELDAAGAALGVEGPIHQQVLDHADLSQPRRGQGEADGPTALDDIGLTDHVLGGAVGEVVDGGEPGAGIDTGLVRGVGLQAPVPVEVIGGQVEADRGQGRQGAGGVELEAGQLHGQGVSAARQYRLDDRGADVADGGGGEPLGLKDGREHAHRRGLAVRAGQREPGDVRAGGVPLKSPGQLDLAPGLDTGRLSGAQDRTGGRYPGRDDQEPRRGVRQGGRGRLAAGHGG